MMKYILTLVMCICMTVCALGAYQYEVDTNGLKMLDNVNLTLHFTRNDLFKNYAELGIISNGQEARYSINDAEGKKFNIGTFFNNDVISMFVVDNSGNAYYGYNYVDLSNGHYQFNIGRYEYFDFKVQPGGATRLPDTPSGQPLPGVLASLAIGGGALVGRKVLKKRRTDG